MAQHRYSADRPIEREADALPGRKEFAKHLAVDIKAWDGENCLVMALYGGWGSGKSSLKNLLKNHLKQEPDPVSVMEFNPWQFSGKSDLTVRFFDEFYLALRKVTKSKRVASQLQEYARDLSGIASLGKLGALALVLAGRPVEALAAHAAADAAGHLSTSQKLKSDKALNDEKSSLLSLEERKTQLSESLRKLKAPFVITIDDIDRLSEEEILEVMQLVKTNADFPNVIFLLLCERSIVVNALDKISGNRGDEFLEKIVQVSYHVPPVTRKALNQELFKGLDSIIGQVSDLQKFSVERWRELYNEGLEGYFRHLRHIYRFLGSFDFHYRHFLKDGYLEVNSLDLIALETFRIFEPALYERLPKYKKILTRSTDHFLQDPLDQSVVDAGIEQLLAGIPEERHEIIRRILMTVFPTITSTFSSKGEIARHEDDWIGEGRACHAKLFDKYLTLVVPEDELSSVDLYKLIEATAERRRFAAICSSINARGLFETAMSRLESAKNKIPLDNLQELISGLFDLPIPDEPPRFFDHESLSLTVYRIGYVSLLRLGAQNRLPVFKQALSEAGNLYIPIRILQAAARRTPADNEFLFDKDQLAELIKDCIAKIKYLLNKNALSMHLTAYPNNPAARQAMRPAAK